MHIGRVFVSHSSDDNPFVDRLVADLANRGISVWYDKLDLRVGDSVPGRINEGLSSAKYFLIVFSPAALQSNWVREEFNAASARQIALGGTFLVPVLYKDCDLPPLIAHRRYADFRTDYGAGLDGLLSLWGKDVSACNEVKSDRLYPWPDVEASDHEFIYLHSTRLDKFFRMSCSLTWTADRTIDCLVETLPLPWSKDLPELGMRWSFNYGLVFADETITLSKELRQAGVTVGSVVKIRINGTYEDLYEKEREDMRPKWYMMTAQMASELMERENAMAEGLRRRGQLTSARLKEIADSCFKHV